MIPFLDLKKINNRFRDDFHASLDKELDASQLILGDSVSNFENEFSEYCGTKYCIGTGNGLDALTIILKGYIELGQLQIGDKVIVPSNTFIATILSVLHAGLVPVFAQPDAKTYNISSKTIKPVLTNEIKAIIVVHLYGQLAEVQPIKDLIKESDILLIEDAAQAHGATSDFGKAGSLSDASAFSFYPSKNLGALGDGGAITTNDDQLYAIIRKMANYGSDKKYVNDVVGYNSRLDSLQASFLSVKLKYLNSDNERRRDIAKTYLTRIKNPKIQLPYYDNSNGHVFYVFVIQVEDRDNFTEYLDENKIGWLIHYPIPPYKQQALKTYSFSQLDFNETLHQRILSIPIGPMMTDNEVEEVIRVLNKY